ncbi:unnamed protein product [Arctogadus glacialis]
MLSPSGEEDRRVLTMSSLTRGRPPLPPPHGPSSDTASYRKETTTDTVERSESRTSRPEPKARSLASLRRDPAVDNPQVKANKTLEQETTRPSPPEPLPRRRLASFGGVSSTGSLSPFTGLGAYNQNNNGNKTSGGLELELNSSTRGSTGSLKCSPQSPMHLHHVRDQMVVALQKLKELEDQVKTIPILQVKISVLQEEKRQLLSQFRNHNGSQDLDDVFRRRAYSTGATANLQKASKVENDVNENQEEVSSDCTQGLRDLQMLSKEMQALERTIKGGHLQEQLGLSNNTPCAGSAKSLAVGTNLEINQIKTCKCTELIETRSIGTGVNLGHVTELEAELAVQQGLTEALEERVGQLEEELKVSALQKGMSLLKLELQAAEERNRVDKSANTMPGSQSKATMTEIYTTSKGVGNHVELREASTGDSIEFCTVGTSCRPEFRSVGTCSDVPIGQWREKVETKEQCVGAHISTNTQGIGTEIRTCDLGTNTDLIIEIGQAQMEYLTVSCGVHDSKARDLCGMVDFSPMALPLTASQHTNTESNSVTRFTNTTHASNTNSSTNTILNTEEKHTNTTQPVTRTVSVSNRVKLIRGVSEPCPVCSGMSARLGVMPTPAQKAKTKDMGVGFTNINDHFLVGLKTRNMASGPSHLPDSSRTRSIGVGEGKVRNLSRSSQFFPQMHPQPMQSQWDPQLTHGMEQMQSLLKEQHVLNSPGTCDQRPRPQDTQCEAQIQSPSWPPNDFTQRDQPNSGISEVSCIDSGVKRKIQLMEQHASSGLQDRSANMPRSTAKKPSADQGSHSRRGSKFMGVSARFKISEAILTACQALRTYLRDRKALSSKELQVCLHTLQQEWFSVSSPKWANAAMVEDYLGAFRAVSPAVLHHVANMADGNGNTSLHYSVSHSNFAVVKKMLDSGVSNVNQQNKAGYTPVMLATLAAVSSPEDMRVVEELFARGDVNAKASQAGQTALMLAVSHGRLDMVRALLEHGADLSLQDEEGSTALMCASEHGHAHIVRLLLAQPACDTALSDSDGSTALSIALEAGHHDIALLLYAHANFSRGQIPAHSSLSSQKP